MIVRPLMGDRIAICPPLVIKTAEIEELFARLARGAGQGPRLGEEGEPAGIAPRRSGRRRGGGKAPRMTLEITPASEADYAIVANLARFYFYDMAEHGG